MRIRVAPAATVLALLGLGTLTLCAHRAAPLDQPLVSARKESFDVRVEVLGVLDAALAFHVTSTVSGDRGKIIQVVEDGSVVSAGDVLLRFDPSPFENEIQRLVGEVRSREATVEVARQKLEVEKSQVRKSIDNGDYDAVAARQEHDRFVAYIDDLAALARKGHAIEAEIAQARRKERQLAASLRKAEGERERVSREAASSVAKAAAELDKAQSELAASRTALAIARSELAKTEVRAPVSGFAVLHEIFSGQAKRKPRAGDSVWLGQPVLYLPDLASMVVKTLVREEDLHKLRPGQAAIVRVEAYPDARFHGEVAAIGVLATDAAGAATAGKHFQVNVNLKESDPRLRPGMTARVSIVAERVRDALAIPSGALFYEGGHPVCHVFDGSTTATRKVGVGRRGDDFVEITQGLNAGDRVSLTKP